MHEHPLIAFYDGSGCDSRGRYLDQILDFTLEELESTHDYIQWLFPLFERSGVNPGAPVLDDDSTHRFRTDQQLRKQLRRAVEVMLRFYGLELQAHDGGLNVLRRPDFGERANVWLNRGNHNFLRLTRILKCLSILHATPVARAMLACLENIVVDHPSVISDRTLSYWRNAVPPQ